MVTEPHEVAAGSESKRGRPRSEAAHQAVLDAAAQLLRAPGATYEELTIERIAAEAGVGKQTIYRWWKNKAAVVLEVFLTGRVSIDFGPVPDTGDLHQDLHRWVAEGLPVSGVEHDDSVSLARGMLAALVSGGEPAYELLQANPIWENMHLTRRMRQAAQKGELKPSVDPVSVASAIMDPFIIRVISTGPPDVEWVRAQVDLVLNAVVTTEP